MHYWFPILLLLGWAIGVWLLRRTQLAPWRDGLSGVQAAATTIALLLACFYYFIERPDAPRMKITVTPTAAPLASPRGVLVAVAIELQNVGQSALMLTDKQPLSLFVQQLTPVSPRIATELVATSSAYPYRFVNADNWRTIATYQTPMNLEIEAGESDNLYYRILLPCQRGLAFIVDARLPKPRKLYDKVPVSDARTRERFTWVKQSAVVTVPDCPPLNPKETANVATTNAPPSDVPGTRRVGRVRQEGG